MQKKLKRLEKEKKMKKIICIKTVFLFSINIIATPTLYCAKQFKHMPKNKKKPFYTGKKYNKQKSEQQRKLTKIIRRKNIKEQLLKTQTKEDIKKIACNKKIRKILKKEIHRTIKKLEKQNKVQQEHFFKKIAPALKTFGTIGLIGASTYFFPTLPGVKSQQYCDKCIVEDGQILCCRYDEDPPCFPVEWCKEAIRNIFFLSNENNTLPLDDITTLCIKSDLADATTCFHKSKASLGNIGLFIVASLAMFGIPVAVTIFWVILRCKRNKTPQTTQNNTTLEEIVVEPQNDEKKSKSNHSTTCELCSSDFETTDTETTGLFSSETSTETTNSQSSTEITEGQSSEQEFSSSDVDLVS